MPMPLNEPLVPHKATFPAAMNRLVVLGAIAWALSIAFFVIQVLAQAAASVPYHMASNVISDLGNTACGADVCSPLHLAVDATFAVVGVFHVAGAILTHSAWPEGWKRDVARSFLVIAGVCLIVAGVVPENVNAYVHRWGALTGLISLNSALVFFGLSITTARRWLAAMTAGSGILGFLGLIAFLGGASVGPVGITERIADYPATAMIVALGAYLLVAAAWSRRLSLGRA
jgi:hypothetical membrane protein